MIEYVAVGFFPYVLHCNGRVYPFDDRLSVAEGHQHRVGIFVGILQQHVQDVIPAGVGPVGAGLEIVVYVGEKAPRVVYIGIPEPVSVVPLLGLLELLRMAVI